MERVVAKMLEEKKKNVVELEAEQREIKQLLKIKMQAKETTGVNLYALQQQLAKVQKQLHATSIAVQETTTTRADAEEVAVEQQALVSRNMALIAKQREQQVELQRELDKWERKVRAAELAHEERSDKLKIVQRAASTAENAVSSLEKQKTDQDLFIDRLTEQVQQLDVDRSLFEAQLASQREETAVANSTLSEAAEQMGAIEFEKTQLRQQWQTALIGMNKRDQALQETHIALEKRREERLTVESELRGMKNEQRTVQGNIDGNSGVTGKLEAERLTFAAKIETLEKERAASEQRFDMLRSSLEQTDAEAAVLLAKKKSLSEAITQLERSIENVDRERQAIEEATTHNKGDETTVSKAVSNMADEARSLQRQMHGVEMDIAGCENETERINLDMLNTVAHGKQLKANVEALRNELKEKDKLIEKYDAVARQRHDTINKKMAQVDFLNRKLGAMTSGVEEENLGPLEATIHNMQKEIERMRSESAELQRLWLQGQIRLVSMVTAIDQQRTTLREDEGRQTVLVQSKVRLNASILAVRARVNTMMKETQAMHNDMARLNRLLAKNKEAQAELANSTFVARQEFTVELQELKAQSIAFEEKHAELQELERVLLDDVCELQEQILYWEKKVQLEREAQQAIDPTGGEGNESEQQKMKNEIHRMELRLRALRRTEEDMIKEMERAIEKREMISMQNRGKKKRSFSTQGELRKQVKQMKSALKGAQRETGELETGLRECKSDFGRVSVETQRKARQYEMVEGQVQELQGSINTALYEKQRCTDAIAKRARMLKRYRAVAGQRLSLDGERVAGELAQAEQQRQAIQSVIGTLQGEFPQLEEVLSRVGNLGEV
jgi:chromosome segregation ATPase